jgi:hypothetical protein
MGKKCVNCGIFLDVPCTNPTCSGHQNESIDDMCVYCVTNQREEMLYVRELSTLLFSSLGDIGHGED